MKFSPADVVAILMTSQGSQRRVAAMLGISHQKVGRILKTGMPDIGGYPTNSRALKSPALLDALSRGLDAHTDLARRAARAQGIPFDKSVPLAALRMPLRDGSPGGRVIVDHTHWLSDRIRNAWLAKMQKSGRYYTASVRSTVDLAMYNKQADKRAREGEYYRGRHYRARDGRRTLAGRRDIAPIFTPYVDMRRGIYIEDTQANLSDYLARKHEPAATGPGTKVADQYLLQLRTITGEQYRPQKRAKGSKRGR